VREKKDTLTDEQVARVALVVSDHREAPAAPLEVMCRCGWRGGTQVDHAFHVADKLADEVESWAVKA
jgi:hypothetical protein